MYEIRYAKPAKRYFKRMEDHQLLAAFKTAVDQLKIDPYAGTQKAGGLRGVYGYEVKYAGENYELAYRIYEESSQLVVVVLAGTRENFYEQLKRLIKP